MRQVAFDISQVAAPQLAEQDVRVVDLDLITPAQQRFDENDQGALAQVIRPSLEAQPDDAYAPVSRLLHQSQGTAQMPFIGSKNSRQQLQPQRFLLRVTGQGPQVLGQTRAAKGKARTEIRRRDIELVI